MTSPATLLRTFLSMAKESLVILCTDGGANDGKGVEVTGTTDGAINVNVTGSSGSSTVTQGNKGTAAQAWYAQLYDGAQHALAVGIGDDVPTAAILSAVKNGSGKLVALTLARAAAASSLPVALSNEDAAKVPALGPTTMAGSTPVTIASDQTAVPVSGTVALGAGTAKIGKVTDQPCTIAGVGQKTTGSSGAVTSGVSGAGYLTILNTHTTDGAYLGTGTVDNTKFLLSAGASVTWPISDVTTVNCFGTGAILSWAFLQVA